MVSKSSIENDKFINNIVDEILPEVSEFTETPLKSAASQRQQLRDELLSTFKLEKFQSLLNAGLASLNELPAADREIIQSTLNQFVDNLQNQTIVNEGAYSYADLLGFPEEIRKKLDQVGGALFKEKKYEASAGIYTILCMIHHIDAGYWCHKGMALQACQDYDQAAGCFEVGHMLAANDPGPLLLRAHCHFKKGEEDDAQCKMEQAQVLMRHDAHFQKLWQPYLDALKNYKGGF